MLQVQRYKLCIISYAVDINVFMLCFFVFCYLFEFIASLFSYKIIFKNFPSPYIAFQLNDEFYQMRLRKKFSVSHLYLN